jgi:hypothetical protein
VNACRFEPDSVTDRSSGDSVPELRLVNDILEDDFEELPFPLRLRDALSSSSVAAAPRTQHEKGFQGFAAMPRTKRCSEADVSTAKADVAGSCGCRGA